ncbi:MAG: imidazoleglycerol-phosphate dehydratase HisB [Candidatus Atribacteria bacterium]|nr:imidazoleglycerol-phosphate dehydratase HisB [Candidatus Atribacteria bacterium]MCD6349467.1 imidazoleglycerol-phosphate dehydratase HisB [Candidatus Atribacteria bacterium]
MERKTFHRRETLETSIELELNLEGKGNAEIQMEVPFFPHLLKTLVFYAGWDLILRAEGDLEVDQHHTVEDTGIVLGEAFLKCLGEKKGIKRFAFSMIPMDEALGMSVVDLSGRPFLYIETPNLAERVGEFEVALVEEFLRAFTNNAKITVHAKIWWGRNTHHCLEALFKSLGQALGEASKIVNEQTIPSTKGIL